MLNELNVAIAEDNPQMMNLLNDMLEQESGFRVIAKADNGEDAYEMIMKTNPDLVLMDIDMPEMDGIETAKHIMEMTDHTVPILFVTALCDRQTVTLCRNLDAAGYIVRPYKPVFVKTEIKRILMGRSEIE